MGSSLADWVAANGAPVSSSVIDGMYDRDPFWLERFGPAGLQFAREDGGFHIRHLVSALRIGRDELLVSYAQWLRELLVARGMCTRHLTENFELLGAALEREAPCDATPAVRALSKASAALTYTGNHASAVQMRENELARGYVLALGQLPNDALLRDARTVLSYAADEIVQPDAKPLGGFVAYRCRQATPRGLWAAAPDEVLRRQLRTTLAGVLPEDVANRVDAAWG